jgi:hypothetical protein
VARWAADSLDALRAADPELPEELNDRAQDNRRPLVAIADQASGPWPARARAAALALSGEETDDQAERGVMLLADLRDIFERHDADQLATATILHDLANLEERPWGEHSRGKPITARGLARLLRPFKVESRTIRIGDDTPKGYRYVDLVEAFERYLPGQVSVQLPQTGPQSATSATTTESLTEMAVSYPPHDPPVADRKADPSARNDRRVADVADKNLEIGGLDRNRAARACPRHPVTPRAECLTCRGADPDDARNDLDPEPGA